MDNLLGTLIRQRRLDLKLTQRALALRVGVARPVLSRWENGKGAPSAPSIEKLARVLDLPTDDLLEGLARVIRRKARRHSPRRPRPRRPPYPIAATVDQMLAIGGYARAVYDDVRKRLTDADLHLILSQLPRDTRHELLVAFHALKHNTRVVECTLDGVRCPLFVLDDYERVNGGFQPQLALLWEGEDERMLIFPQVRVRIPGTQPARLDFLIRYQRRGRRAEWLFLEIDGDHGSKRNLDATRTEGIGIPEIRHDNDQTLSQWYFQRLIQDVRKKAAIAAEWTRSRKRQARADRARRFAEAEERRLAA